MFESSNFLLQLTDKGDAMDKRLTKNQTARIQNNVMLSDKIFTQTGQWMFNRRPVLEKNAFQS